MGCYYTKDTIIKIFEKYALICAMVTKKKVIGIYKEIKGIFFINSQIDTSLKISF
jgi:hypothetical protein